MSKAHANWEFVHEATGSYPSVEKLPANPALGDRVYVAGLGVLECTEIVVENIEPETAETGV